MEFLFPAVPMTLMLGYVIFNFHGFSFNSRKLLVSISAEAVNITRPENDVFRLFILEERVHTL
jgi:hypothetical protein